MLEEFEDGQVVCWCHLCAFHLPFNAPPFRLITKCITGCQCAVGDSAGLAVQLEKRCRGVHTQPT